MLHPRVPPLRIGILCCLVFAGATRVDASVPCVPGPVTHGAISADAPSPATDLLTIGSLNIHGRPDIIEALVRWTHERVLDILMLQEVGQLSVDGAALGSMLSERLGFHFVYAPARLVGDTQTQGLAIVSRYPLGNVRVRALPYFHLRFRSRCRIALEATVATPAGDVRVVNLHLDTRINSRRRLAQLTAAVDGLHDIDEPQIIGGDFNTMNVGWFQTMWPFPYLQRQTAAVRTLLASNGFQTPFNDSPPTFRFLGIPLRLDWLFLKQVDPLDWSVDRVPLTDHRAVWAHVRNRSRRR
jgi:endonuclease/exonuclease/phosphatase family metal-dependent hydrolase